MKLIIGTLVFTLLTAALLPFASAATPAIFISSPEAGKQYFTDFILLNVSTDIIANVSYALNNGPSASLYKNDVKGESTITLKQGQNDLLVIAQNGTDKAQKSLSFRLERCRIDAKDIGARGDSVIFAVENTGTLEQDIQYSVKVNLNKINVSTDKLLSGQKKEYAVPFVFKLGNNYQLEANVTSSCGAQDFVGSGFAKTGPSSCLNPAGGHDTFRTNSTEGKTYRCNNGVWGIVEPFTSAEDKYCSGGDRCGDGVLNCGETKETCLADFTGSAARCDCRNKKFFNQTKLTNPAEFFDVCKSNCTLDCLSDFSCQEAYECKSFQCLPKAGRCGVKIQDFDYTEQTGINENGFIFANIKNTGLIVENITTKVYLRNSLINKTSFLLNSEAEKLEASYYKSGVVGDQEIKIEASADCASTDTKTATVNVRNIVVVPAIGRPLVTGVKLLSEKIETALGSEKSLTLNLKTSQPQIFLIKVLGVPEDWLDYPSTIGITEDRDVNIFIKPKNQGNYTLTVLAEGKNQTFTSRASLNVLQPKQETALDQTIIIWMIVVLVVVFSGVIFAGARYLRL